MDIFAVAKIATANRVSVEDIRIIVELARLTQCVSGAPQTTIESPVSPTTVISTSFPIGSDAWLSRAGVLGNKTTLSHFNALRESGYNLQSWWGPDAISNGVRKVRLGFVVAWSPYTDEITDAILAEAKEKSEAVRSVVTSCAERNGVKTDTKYEEIFENIRKKVDEVRTGVIPVSPFNLFGVLLRPRRVGDVAILKVYDTESVDTAKTGNSYYKDTAELVFRDYKTLANYGIQHFCLKPTKEALLIHTESQLAMARAFLESIANNSYMMPYFGKGGTTGKEAVMANTMTGRFLKANGFSTNDSRHFNATEGRSLGKAQQLAIAGWMAHNVATAVSYAINVGPPAE